MALFSNLHPLTSTVLKFKNKAARKKFRHLTSTVEDTSRATDISAISDNFLTYNVTTAVF